MNKLSKAEKIDRVIFKVMYGVSICAAISLMIIAVLCTVDSLGSRIFRFSIPNGTDWVAYLNIPVVFLSMGYLQVERGNTVVDILSGKFPKVVKKIVGSFANLIGVAVCGYLGFKSVELTLTKIASHATSSSARNAFLVWPFAGIVALGYLLVAISFLWCLFREYLIPPEKRMGAVVAMAWEEEKDKEVK